MLLSLSTKTPETFCFLTLRPETMSAPRKPALKGTWASQKPLRSPVHRKQTTCDPPLTPTEQFSILTKLGNFCSNCKDYPQGFNVKSKMQFFEKSGRPVQADCSPSFEVFPFAFAVFLKFSREPAVCVLVGVPSTHTMVRYGDLIMDFDALQRIKRQVMWQKSANSPEQLLFGFRKP